MAQPNEDKDTVFNPGKARWLQAKAKKSLMKGKKLFFWH